MAESMSEDVPRCNNEHSILGAEDVFILELPPMGPSMVSINQMADVEANTGTVDDNDMVCPLIRPHTRQEQAVRKKRARRPL